VSARTKARKRAIDVLYVADVRELPIADVFADESLRAAEQPQRSSSWGYAADIISGVNEHQAEIDELIETYAQGWTLQRMPMLDRAILRIGIWEILYNPEVPNPVAIAEAVESATVLSTDDSAGFINGLLGRIAQLNA
jgi:N utilization substance protein B